MVSFLKNGFSGPIMRFFWQQIRKTFMLENLEKNDEEGMFFFVPKKRFHLLENLSSQKWEGENMTVGAGRLVIFSLTIVKNCRLLID